VSFADEYAALEERFGHEVENDRALYGLSRGDCILARMMQPPERVDHVFIGSEPSLKRWAPSEAAASRVIAQGYKISAQNIEDFVLHFCIRKYLLSTDQTYAVTDLSKGGMRVQQADRDRLQRYER